MIIYAAIAAKQIMEEQHIPGTLVIWPGVAEELLGSKAWYVRDGYFKNIDACIFTHVSGTFASNYGDDGSNGLVSVIDLSIRLIDFLGIFKGGSLNKHSDVKLLT